MEDIRLYFIGDSFVNGTGDEQKLGWAGRLSAQAQSDQRDITYYNLGIRGNTSTDIRLRWLEECQRRMMADTSCYFIFSFGVNDTVILEDKPRVDLETGIANARDILQQASGLGQTLLIGPPPIDDVEQNSRIAKLDQALGTVCEELKLPFLSVLDALGREPVWLHEVANNDGAHPRQGGYQKLADLITSWEQWPFRQM